MTKFDISESGNRQTEDQELSLKEIIFIIRKYLWLIVLITTVVFTLSVLYTLVSIPEYRASTMVEVSEQSQTLPMFDVGLDVGSNVIMNEIEKLKSRTLAEEVVNRLWDSPYRNNLFIFGTRIYQPEGLRKPVRKLWDSIFNSQQMEFSSNTEDTISDSLFNNAIRTIRQSIAVTNERKTNILNISMASNNPQEAALLANSVANTYQQRDMEWSTGEINNLSNFLENQLKEVESDLGVVENELRQFKEQEQIYELKGNAQLVLAQLGDVEKKYNTAKASISIIQERKRYINSKLSQEEKTLTNQLLNSINSKLIALRDEIALSEGNLIRNISLYGEEHEAVIDLKQNIDQLKAQLEQQTNKLIAQGTSVADPINYRQSLMDTILYLEAREANYNTQAQEYYKLVNSYERKLTTLPAKSLRFAQMERDRTVLAETYSLMRKRFEEARITEASQLGKIRIIDPAIPPRSKTKPKTKVNLAMGLLLGLGLGSVIALILERTDNSINNISDIKQRGVPILGIIPDIKKLSDGKSRKGKRKKNGGILRARELKRRIILREEPKSPISEAYRSLRTNLMYSAVEKSAKTIIVTSPGPGEGKTTTIVNLAITFANIGKRTLLVDTDLRRPVVHKLFNLNNEPGVTHFLSGFPRDVHPLVKQSGIKNLQIITAGDTPADPSVMLSSRKMHEFVKNLELMWDIVLFDAPPAVAVTDASILAKEIDQFLLVVKSGQTNKFALDHTLQLLNDVNAPLAGIILNAVSPKTNYESSYYYHEYYNYYGKEKD